MNEIDLLLGSAHQDLLLGSAHHKADCKLESAWSEADELALGRLMAHGDATPRRAHLCLTLAWQVERARAYQPELVPVDSLILVEPGDKKKRSVGSGISVVSRRR